MNEANPFVGGARAGRRWRAEGFLYFGFGLLALLLAAGGAWLFWDATRLAGETRALERRRLAMAQGKELLIVLREAALGRRGYVLTGDRAYMNQYLEVLTELNPHFQKFQRELGDTPAHKERLDRLEDSIRELVNFWQTSVAHYQLQPKDTGQHAVMTRQAAVLLQQVRAEIDQLNLAQEPWLKARQAALAGLAHDLPQLSLAEAGLALALGLMAVILVRRDARRRREADATVAHSDTRVREAADQRKTAEMQLRNQAAVIEHSNDFIGLCTADFKLFYVNEAGRRMAGLASIEEARRSPVLDYFGSEDRPLIETQALPALEREGRWSGPARLRHFQTGEPVPILWKVFAIKDATARVHAWGLVGAKLAAKAEAAAGEAGE